MALLNRCKIHRTRIGQPVWRIISRLTNDNDTNVLGSKVRVLVIGANLGVDIPYIMQFNHRDAVSPKRENKMLPLERHEVVFFLKVYFYAMKDHHDCQNTSSLYQDFKLGETDYEELIQLKYI